MQVYSSSFKNNSLIPLNHVCIHYGGNNISPPLEWTPIKIAKSYAIMCFDVDIPSNIKKKINKDYWTHWIVYNLTSSKLPIGIQLSSNQLIVNNSGNYEYSGMCPPSGSGVHRYIFRVYALDDISKPLKSEKEFITFVKTHIIDSGVLIGYYP